MKKNLIIIAVLSLFFSCDKDEDSPIISKKELLTGTTQRGWYMHSMTPDVRCSSGADDTWTFFSDGSFEYDHGTITNDINDDDGGCADFANLLGSWELTEKEAHIKIIAESRKDDPSTTFDIVIMEGTLTSISEEKFIITVKDPSSDDEGTIEFRRR